MGMHLKLGVIFDELVSVSVHEMEYSLIKEFLTLKEFIFIFKTVKQP